MHILRLTPDKKVLQFVCGPYVYAEATLPRAARVLEVGGGNDPHPGSDVILDLYIDDNRDRPGQADMLRHGLLQRTEENGETATVVISVPIVCGNVLSLPFPDKSFDFIIAKDIMEHIDDVEQGFAELSRVGKAGFVDVPRMVSEWLYPQGTMHKHVFSFDGETLYAHPIAFQSPFKRMVHDAHAASEEWQCAWADSRHLFHIAHIWEGVARCVKANPAHLYAPTALRDLTKGA